MRKTITLLIMLIVSVSVVSGLEHTFYQEYDLNECEYSCMDLGFTNFNYFEGYVLYDPTGKVVKQQFINGCWYDNWPMAVFNVTHDLSESYGIWKFCTYVIEYELNDCELYTASCMYENCIEFDYHNCDIEDYYMDPIWSNFELWVELQRPE